MVIFGKYPKAEKALNEICEKHDSFYAANGLIAEKFGVSNFFENEAEYRVFNETLKGRAEKNEPVSRNKDEYGDYQTNLKLSEGVCGLLSQKKEEKPDLILEPTCGEGNFIIAALKHFAGVNKIIGFEVYKPYLWEAKLKVMDFCIKNNRFYQMPEVRLLHGNFFKQNMKSLLSEVEKHILILGNPPWVTSSELSKVNSANLPLKSNLKKDQGLEALTGKSNFDISESMVLSLLESFHKNQGSVALLLKNSVIKKVLELQKDREYQISNLEKHNIDTLKEFSASAGSSFFYLNLGKKASFTCQEFNFYTGEKIKEFGWKNGNFAHSLEEYETTYLLDGKSPFEWRQGIKHDCSSVMEVEKVGELIKNKRNQSAEIEEDLLHGLLKGSDLKGGEIKQSRKYVIVTQKKPGQDTHYLKFHHPKTYHYLWENKHLFEQRKSKVYKNKPAFSIFGIGPYSFLPYKVAIPALYKTTNFTLVSTPDGEKPFMLDDTCYFIGFEKYEDAKVAHALLNSDLVQAFLKSVVFSDAKRTITKELLMRINLLKAYESIDPEIFLYNHPSIQINHWKNFGELISNKTGNTQLKIFH